jgi:hypothetical protein
VLPPLEICKFILISSLIFCNSGLEYSKFLISVRLSDFKTERIKKNIHKKRLSEFLNITQENIPIFQRSFATTKKGRKNYVLFENLEKK